MAAVMFYAQIQNSNNNKNKHKNQHLKPYTHLWTNQWILGVIETNKRTYNILSLTAKLRTDNLNVIKKFGDQSEIK